ncbi:hypothetical protein BA898_06125 [Spiribacter roseus]|nr:hypothetical protein BA898_06125 [Spiribacter roseus]
MKRALLDPVFTESPDNRQNDWLHLSKLLGHRDLATTLITYNHLMHWVHADVLDRAYGGRRKWGQ